MNLYIDLLEQIKSSQHEKSFLESSFRQREQEVNSVYGALVFR